MPTTFAFYKARGDWSDRIIRHVTRAPYSHVELLRHSPIDGAAECISASKRDGNKVRIKEVHFKADHWDFIALGDVDAAECWGRAFEHLDAPYDMLGAVLSITPWPVQTPDRIFCSELMGRALGLPNAHALHPGALAEILLARPDVRRTTFISHKKAELDDTR